ncbi:hypothetical protein M6D93_04070 [Jatrophihabitans telluris]|uniref:Uncharacterized protein n=1 Tax=Jatrophihabitans telluris TaxID=2038343 RepID=A0ABY4R0E8_9ACTN|nr:hypothetical protein [Jatrophihabitans telluris]UQX89185.1 hypothetical protein M6D93_04070 [Jatrophihabitans telluris]
MVVSGQVDNLGGSAFCPSGWTMTGGGFEQPFVADETKRDLLRASRPAAELTDYNGWFVVFDPRAANNFQLNGPTTVYAVCVLSR